MAIDRLVPSFATGPHHICEDPWTELAWAPILGPSAMALWRRFGVMVEAGYPIVDAQLLGQLVGLPGRDLLDKGLDRLVRFGIAWDGGNGTLEVPLVVPMPGPRQRRSWPPMLATWAEQAGVVDPVTVP